MVFRSHHARKIQKSNNPMHVELDENSDREIEVI